MDIDENKEPFFSVSSDMDKKKIQGMRDLMQPTVIELEGGDMKALGVEERIKAEERLNREKSKRPHSFYRDLIFTLVGVRLDEKRARDDWKAILDNKYYMSEKLGRNVGIRVAALDYYANIRHHLIRPVVVDADTLANTVELSITDGLTGAYNRYYFDAVMDRFFQEARQGHRNFCLAILDVDHFKVYNDHSGHIAGDLALMEIVRIIHTVARAEDIVARYGGEEFALIFPGIDLEKAFSATESIRHAIRDFRFPNEECVPGGNLTISGGLTTHDEQCQNAEIMIKEADEALYQAKREGRNRTLCFKEIS